MKNIAKNDKTLLKEFLSTLFYEYGPEATILNSLRSEEMATWSWTS